MTRGDFHGNQTYGNMLEMEVYIPLYYLQIPKVSPKYITFTPASLSKGPLNSIFYGTCYLLGALPACSRYKIHWRLPHIVI